MDKPTCPQLRAQLQEIKELKAEFDFELVKIKDTRNTAPALKLEEEMRERLEFTYTSIIETQIREAKEILDRDVLGPDAIEAAFGFKLETKDTPLIPFGKAELERAKELGQFLVLRVDKTSAGQLLTMKTMNELKGGKTKDGGKILFDFDSNIDWYKNEEFYTTDTSSFGWALVSKEVILNSTDKNYVEQTEEIANYLETKVFKDQEMPEEYKEAVNEFKRSQDEIKEITSSNWKLAAEKLAKLKINQLFRHTPVEFLYDIVLMKENHGENLLLNTAVWTNRLDSVGGLVYVANTDSGGLGVYTIRSDEFGGDGWLVNFSRKGVI